MGRYRVGLLHSTPHLPCSFPAATGHIDGNGHDVLVMQEVRQYVCIP